MKKKFLVLMLIVSVIVTGVMPCYALKSGITNFSITPIRADQKHRFIGVNFTLDKTYANSNVLVAFYKNDELIKLTPYDASSRKVFEFKPKDGELETNIFKNYDTAIKTYVTVIDTANKKFYDVDKTPDEIKLYIWNKNNLTPKVLCDNVLTKEVISQANAEVVANLTVVPNAIKYLNRYFIRYEDEYPDSYDVAMVDLLGYVQQCAQNCKNDAANHIMTSLYAQEKYKAQLSEISRLVNEDRDRAMDLLDFITDPEKMPTQYYNPLNDAINFLNIRLKN